MEIVEHFGHICHLPEPVIVGYCAACQGDIYDYEHTICDCGKEVHIGCTVACATCGHVGCECCMKRDSETLEYFCGEECEV